MRTKLSPVWNRLVVTASSPSVIGVSWIWVSWEADEQWRVRRRPDFFCSVGCSMTDSDCKWSSTGSITKFVAFLKKLKFARINKLAFFLEKGLLLRQNPSINWFQSVVVYYCWSVWLTILWKLLWRTDILFFLIFFLVDL